jgi:anti-sigma B factor antagonist
MMTERPSGQGFRFTDWGFRVWSSGGLPVVTVPAEIDLQNAPALGDALMAASTDHPTVIVDMTANVFCDSSALARLVMALKRAKAAGGELRLVLAPSHVPRVFKATGIDRIVKVFGTVAEAAAG